MEITEIQLKQIIFVGPLTSVTARFNSNTISIFILLVYFFHAVTLSAAKIGGGSTERKRELHVPTQRNSTFSTGNDKGVRHVTFGGAWEVSTKIYIYIYISIFTFISTFMFTFIFTSELH